jgi:tRNA(Arg) A34 adenosine deaminase TadA
MKVLPMPPVRRRGRRGSPPSTFGVVDRVDVMHLRRCLELARAARGGGNEPFGSLLVGGDGTVLADRANTVGTGDVTGHPELALAAWASSHLTMRERAEATLYTSCESCAMCAGGQYWAGIGRLVFALSGAQLAGIAPAGARTLRLSSREVFARGNARVEVDGPCEDLAAEALAVFDGYWSATETS